MTKSQIGYACNCIMWLDWGGGIVTNSKKWGGKRQNKYSSVCLVVLIFSFLEISVKKDEQNFHFFLQKHLGKFGSGTQDKGERVALCPTLFFWIKSPPPQLLATKGKPSMPLFHSLHSYFWGQGTAPQLASESWPWSKMLTLLLLVTVTV